MDDHVITVVVEHVGMRAMRSIVSEPNRCEPLQTSLSVLYHDSRGWLYVNKMYDLLETYVTVLDDYTDIDLDFVVREEFPDLSSTFYELLDVLQEKEVSKYVRIEVIGG